MSFLGLLLSSAIPSFVLSAIRLVTTIFQSLARNLKEDVDSLVLLFLSGCCRETLMTLHPSSSARCVF